MLGRNYRVEFFHQDLNQELCTNGAGLVSNSFFPVLVQNSDSMNSPKPAFDYGSSRSSTFFCGIYGYEFFHKGRNRKEKAGTGVFFQKTKLFTPWFRCLFVQRFLNLLFSLINFHH